MLNKATAVQVTADLRVFVPGHTWHKAGTASRAHFSMMAATNGTEFSRFSIFEQ